MPIVDRKKALEDMVKAANEPLMDRFIDKKIQGQVSESTPMDPQSSANFQGLQRQLAERAKANEALRQQMPDQSMDNFAADQLLGDERAMEAAARREQMMREAMGARESQPAQMNEKQAYQLLKQRMGK